MMSKLSTRPIVGNNESPFGDDYGELGLLLREQRRPEADDLEKELNLYRSGSAPPTIEGSLTAVGELFNHGLTGGSSAFAEFARNKNVNGLSSEEELRSDPAYLSYYNANVNLNPRLPPPLFSREEWRYAQRLHGGSSAIGDRRKVNKEDGGGNNGGRSIFSMPPGFSSKKQENEDEKEKVRGSEWGGDGLIGLHGLGLGSKQKSLAEIFQEDLSRAALVLGHLSRPASRNAYDENPTGSGPAELELAGLARELSSSNLAHDIHNSFNPQQSGSSAASSYSYAAALGASLSRSSTPDPIARAPSPCPTPIGGNRKTNAEKRNIKSPISFNGVPPHSNGLITEENNLSSRIEEDTNGHKNYIFSTQGAQSNTIPQEFMIKHEMGKFNMSSVPQLGKMGPSLRGEMQKNVAPSKNSYLKGSSYTNGGGVSQYQHLDGPNSYLNQAFGGYPMSPISGQLGVSNMPPLFENASAMAMSAMDSRMGNQIAGNAMQASYVDPVYMQYLKSAEYSAAQMAALNDPSLERNYMGNSYTDPFQKSYLGKMGSSIPHGYYANPAFGLGFSYPGSPLTNHVIPNSSSGPMRHSSGFNMRIHGGMRNGVIGPYNNMDCGGFGSSLLEEFKGNKTRCFELLEIAGHVVEFSADQYGSRFIQQKLETATTEEKNMVFQEIFPQVLTLMTDVFGNYVIQKFFEHGMKSQRRELAEELFDHVLNLSLQMYGCRVIQKAIEVVDVDQKIRMVKELDGHVIRCVRDQNGNHVIQKCIECVPEENIQFIITTFFGNVVTLSTHPYGCRVMQRVLEHCKDENTQRKVMEEILSSISMLARDQYGNYVVQHVLEHGKPHERSTIIRELAGNVVQMSQQKFASNVVEKCLTFGDSSEKQLLVDEMLGTTDENEPLQAMMKDQFANYVVQKVLETCSDQQRELILSRIKVHLNALKKYTFGKHIVARVEKLVAAGERRMMAEAVAVAAQSSNPA